MNDLVLRHLVWARARDQSWLRRAFGADRAALDMGLVDDLQTGWVWIRLRAQHERIEQVAHEAPRSHIRCYTFVDTANPRRPAAGSFEGRSTGYHLRPTLAELRCGGCRGTGRGGCAACAGTGRVWCARGPSCERCQAGAKPACNVCDGTGEATCGRCEGQGVVISWVEERYTWLVRDDQAELPPLRAPPPWLRSATKRLAERDEDEIRSFDADVASSHLEGDSAEGHALLGEARSLEADLLRRAHARPERCLHTEVRRWLLPVRCAVLRRDELVELYALLGGGPDPVQAAPPARPDPWKILGWLALVLLGCVLSSLLLSRLVTTSAPGLEAPPELLTGGVAAAICTALAAPGLARVLRDPPRVPVIAILPLDGRPSALLALLAHLGARSRRLVVEDAPETTLLAELQGVDASLGSASLRLLTAAGDPLVLVELRQADRLDEPAWRRALGAVDAALLLEPEREGGDPHGLRARVIRAAIPWRALGPGSGSASLHEIAQAWIAAKGDRTDEILDFLWGPIAGLLDQITRRSVGGGAP